MHFTPRPDDSKLHWHVQATTLRTNTEQGGIWRTTLSPKPQTLHMQRNEKGVMTTERRPHSVGSKRV